MPDVFEGNALLQLVDRLRGFFIGRDEVLSSSGVAVDHGTLSGLTDDDHAQYLLTNGGRTLTGNMAVQATVTIDGVDISAHAASANSHHNQQHAITGADHTVTGTTYQIVGLTGTNTLGLLTPATTVGANQIPIGGTGGAITWSGAQTFSALGTFNAGITVNNTVATFNASATIPTGQKLTTPTIDSGAALTLQPTTNLILDPANNITSMGSGVSIQASSYESQTTGWRVTDAGEADFRYLFVDEMHAKSFIADLEQALAGGQIIAKSVAVLHTAYTLPAAGAASNFTVRDLPSATGMAAFVANDYVRFRSFSRAAGSLTIADAWGVVTGYTDNGDGTQTWTFTRSSGADAGTASGAIEADAIVLDYGTAGNGIHEVNAIDGAYGLNSPYSQVATWASHPRTMTTRTRIGNLRGIFSVANEYGLYAGTGTAVTNRYIRASSESVSLVNVPLALYDGTNNTMLMTAGSSNNSPSLAMGATLPTGPLTGSGIWMGKDGSDYELRAGTITGGVLTTGIHWDGSSLNIQGAVVVGPGLGFTSNAVGHWQFNGVSSRADFSLNPHSATGITGTATTGVYAGPGLFNKSYRGGETVTNLITNPSIETNTTSWAAVGAGTTATRVATDSYFGAYCLEVAAADVSGAGVSCQDSSRMTVSASTSYTFSVYIRVTSEASKALALRIAWYNSGGSLISNSDASITATSEWGQFVVTDTSPATAASAYVQILRGTSGTHTYHVDGAQFAEGAYAKTYADGSLGSGYSWSGTAHASTSSRGTAGYISYATPPSTGERGSIACWVMATQASTYAPGSTDYDAIFECNYGSGGVLLVLTHAAGPTSAIRLFAGSGTKTAVSTSFPGGTWKHIVGTWDSTAAKIYVDGALVETDTDATAVSFGSDVTYIGAWDALHYFNGAIDDLVLFDRVLSADEVKAMYGGGWASAKPFNLSAGPFTLTLTGPSTGRVLGHAGGLFGYDAAGAEAFALTAGAATWGSQYSGGSALAAGDLVLGDPDARHLFYDASAGTLAIKSNTTTVFSVDASGNAAFQSGYIGTTAAGWTVNSNTIYSTYVRLLAGAANTANIQVGNDATNYVAGLNSASADSDIAIWAGIAHGSRASAPFRVRADGAMTATSATITGTITANSGYIGTTSGWTIGSGTISATGITLAGGASPYVSLGSSEVLRLSPTGLTVLQAGFSTSYFKWLESMPSGAEVAGIYAFSDTESHQVSLRSFWKAGSSGSLGTMATSIYTTGPSSVAGSASIEYSDSSDDFNFNVSMGSIVPLRISCDATNPGIFIIDSRKTSTGHPSAVEGTFYVNTVDNGLYMYADGGWRTITTW